MWPSFAKTLGRRQGVDPPLPVRRPPPAQRSSRGAAQGPDRARQREPPDPRQGDPHLRDPVSGRAHIRLTAPLRKHLLRQPAERRNQDSKIPRGTVMDTTQFGTSTISLILRSPATLQMAYAPCRLRPWSRTSHSIIALTACLASDIRSGPTPGLW